MKSKLSLKGQGLSVSKLLIFVGKILVDYVVGDVGKIMRERYTRKQGTTDNSTRNSMTDRFFLFDFSMVSKRIDSCVIKQVSI